MMSLQLSPSKEIIIADWNGSQLTTFLILQLFKGHDPGHA